MTRFRLFSESDRSSQVNKKKSSSVPSQYSKHLSQNNAIAINKPGMTSFMKFSYVQNLAH